MSLKTNLHVSENLKNAFQNARDEGTRHIKVQIKDETFNLVSSEVQSGTSSIDFKKVPTLINANEPCIVLYRDKEFTLPAPWIMIVYIPDSADVNSRMLYSASKVALRDYLGKNSFSKIKDFSSADEVTWAKVQTVDIANDSKPWSQREITILELNQQENQARNEFTERLNLDPTDVHTSGYSPIVLPLTEKTKQALNRLRSKQINWIQLTLGDEYDKIDTVTEKTVGENDLVNNITFQEPQFYLYNLNGNVILIYCCPDDNTNIKNRMVYSTCKATLADQIRQAGVPVVKKFDVRTKEEVNIQNLKEETARKASVNFRATDSILRSGINPNKMTGRNARSPPPDDDDSNANIKSKLFTNDPPQGGSSYMLNPEKSPKKLPKGVVMPPPGAYC